MQTNSLHIKKRILDRLKDLPARPSFSAQTVKIFIMAAAITVISFLAVDIFYKVVGMQLDSGKMAGKDRPATAAVMAGQVWPIERYAVITERNLFMTTLKAIADKSMALTPSEEYTAFELKGTIAGSDTMGYAVVEEKGKGKQKLYRIGEMIGSAKLVRVTRNTAVLNNAGRELIMKIKENGEMSLPGSGLRPPGGGIAVSREDVTKSLGDLKSIMSQAVVRPFMSDGVQQGFVISNIVPGSLYERLGLKNGDVVMELNGKKLDSADDVLQLVSVMQSGGSVSVNLMRNGKTESLNYAFH